MDKDFKDRSKGSGDGDVANGDDGDGGDQNVDEHHQHATILRQLLELKSSVAVRGDEAEKPGSRYFGIFTRAWEVGSDVHKGLISSWSAAQL